MTTTLEDCVTAEGARAVIVQSGVFQVAIAYAPGNRWPWSIICEKGAGPTVGPGKVRLAYLSWPAMAWSVRQWSLINPSEDEVAMGDALVHAAPFFEGVFRNAPENS